MFDFLRKIGTFFLDTLETVLVVAAIFVVAYLFFFQPHQVIGNSMDPNFHDREYILTDKISYRFREPKRGEVIIFKSPPDPEKEYIKRIIGLPEEKIKISQGKIYINDKQLTEYYLPREFFVAAGSFLKEEQESEIGKNEYFVLGDNRNHSSDSRDWGLVKKREIIGKAWFRYWPLSRFGLVIKAAPKTLPNKEIYRSVLKFGWSSLNFL